MMTVTANTRMRPETTEVEHDVFRLLILLKGLIPSLVDQDRYAQSRDPIEMIVQG
jgi:hypothetical protein